MKVLFFITEDWYFWSHRLFLAKAVLESGNSVVIATHVGDYGERIEAEGFHLVHVDFQRENVNLFSGFILALKLVRVCRREKPDIVHNVALKPVLLGTLAARFAKVPRVINTIAGLGHLFIQERKSLIRHLFQWGLKLLLKGENVKIIVQNPDDHAFFLDSGLSRPEQLFLVRGSGVDTGQFSSERQEAEVPMVVCHSRMLWSKGVGEFVEAARLLKGRGKKVRMILVGAPDKANPQSVPRPFLEALNAEKVVEYWGFRKDIAEILKMAAISTLPSYREGLPKSLLEAAAAGLPLVAFNVPGCRELVRPGENGLLVPCKDVSALADAIEWLLDNPGERERMGRKSREIALTEFSQEIIIRQILNVYSSRRKEIR